MTGTLNNTVPLRDAGPVPYVPRMVTKTAAFTVDGSYDGQTIYLNNATGFATTLPAAKGTGAKYRFFIATTVSSGSHTINTASASDVYKGFAHLFGDDAAALGGFSTTTGVTITMDGSTRGGFAGDIVELEDVATNVWSVRMYGHATGTEATPFS